MPLVNRRVTGNAAFMLQILVLAILAAPAWADWLENYHSGENFLAQGRTANALECLQSAAREAETSGAPDAQLAAVYDALGRADMGSARYRDGKRYFERALRLAADGPLETRATVTSNLGQACQALGELVRAEQLFRQALTAMPKRADLWNLLGGVLVLQRRYKEAEDALTRALSNPADAANVTAVNDIAVIYEARGKLHEAAGLYERAISSVPAGQSRARMLANLGALRLKLGNPAGAVVALGQSLQEMESAVGPTHPDVAKVLEVYDRVLRKSGHKAEAIELAQRAKSIRSAFIGQDNTSRATVDYRDLK
jgi:tetratricopeptide (TPR) repeat protein